MAKQVNLKPAVPPPPPPAPVGPPTVVRVVNNQAKGIGIPPAPGFAGRNLLPGGNDVSLAHLLAVKDHAGFRWYIDSGWVTLAPTGEGTPEGPEPPATLDGYRPEGAVAIVQAEARTDVLRRWASNEARELVADALAARLTALGA